MHRERDLPRPSGAEGGVIVLEAPRGQSRRGVLEAWAAEAGAGGTAAWVLPCDVSEAGLWAGVNSLVEALLPLAERHAPDLLETHVLELSTVVPSRVTRRATPETLTEAAVGAEAVRNFALDRAYRIPHGVIDFFDALCARAAVSPRKVLVCDDFDRSGSLVRRFFRELLRRRGRALGITVLVAVEPGGAETAAAELGWAEGARAVRLDLPADLPEPRSPAEATALARALQDRVERDFGRMEVRIPELIRLWQESEHPENSHTWEAFALGRYNHRGFYEDALPFVDPVLRHLDEAANGIGYFTRWNLVGSIFGALAAVGQVERAYRVVKEEAFDKITDALDRARVCYVMSMLHARFLPQRDPVKAEEYLLQGLRIVAEADDAPADDRHFLHVFLNNGLALVRHRQGRSSEAVQLCQSGYEHLTEHMGDDRHRLHRSVLLYNIAQVFTATGEHEKALEYFTKTMEMDPNYSEYHNERGNVYLKLGRLEEAMDDYRAAIRMSPPYPEVWTNLGQCFRKMGRPEDAVEAYARALDLDPAAKLARGARAQVLEALGRFDEALADYDALLEHHPAQPQVLAQRAVLRYRAGRVAESVADLDRAIGMAPSVAALYRNRAVALADLDRAEEAARDLASYLELVPGAADRAEVEERIAALGELAPA